MNKTPKMLKVERRLNEPLEDFLKRRYIEERKTSTQIAKEIDENGQIVLYWLRKFDIPVRSRSESKLPDGFVVPSKERLYELYVKRGNTILQISNKLGIGHTTTRNLLIENNIPMRSRSESSLPKDFIKPKEELLEDWYVKERKSTYWIADRLDVHNTTVSKWLRNIGIQIREKKSIYDDKKYRKKIIDDLLKELNKNPKELLTTDFTKGKQRDGKSYYGIIGWYIRKYKCKVGEARDKLIENLYDIQIPKRIKSGEQFIDFLKKDETAKNLAVAAVSLNGEAVDVEKIITEIYDGKFKDDIHLHNLLEENTNEILDLVRGGITNLGAYLGEFSLNRDIIPVLIGQAITSIPEERITDSLEERLVRILRVNYSPRFNEDPYGALKEVKTRINESEDRKKRLYERLYNHYQEVLRLGEQLR